MISIYPTSDFWWGLCVKRIVECRPMIIYNSVNEESVLKDSLTQQPNFNIKQKGVLKM